MAYRKSITKYILAGLLVFCLIIPLKVNAEDYTDLDIGSGSIVIAQDGNYHITGISNGNNITINSGVNANIRLDGVKITSNNSPIYIADHSTGNVTIELIGNNELHSTGGPAIRKDGDADGVGRLTICGDGSLIANTTATDGAGIGSSNCVNTRNIYITGGNITATAGTYGAGIGGGGGGGCASDIYISGGTVTATGGSRQGAGIGGGSDSSGRSGDAKNIFITGGTVTATGQGRGAGIGGGNGTGDYIYITGGTVKAEGSSSTVDIGGTKDSQGPLVIAVPVEGKDTSQATYNNTENKLVYQDGTYTVSGDITLPVDLEIREGETLSISAGASFTNNAVMTNNGTIENEGNFTNSQTLVNNGAISSGTLNLQEGSSYVVDNRTVEIVSDTAVVTEDGLNRGNAAIKETEINSAGEVIKTVKTETDGSNVTEEIQSDGSVLETKKNPDGKVTETTKTNQDRSSEKTEYTSEGTVVTKTDKDGNITETTTTDQDGVSVKTENKTDGSTVTTKTDKDGNITEIIKTDKDGQDIEKVTVNKDGSYVKEGFTPSMIEGNKSEYDGKTILSFCSDDEVINFIQVNVDGKKLDDTYYEVAGEKLKVTLKKEFLDTLSKGNHALEIVSTNGTAKGIFIVSVDKTNNLEEPENNTQKEPENNNPKKPENNNPDKNAPATGDNNNLALWMLVLVLSGSMAIGLCAHKRKSASREVL